MREVGLFQRELYADILEVDSYGAIDGALILARRLGVLAGPSSGAAYMAALRHLASVDATCTERRTAVFIVCDRLEPYLSYMKELRPELFGLTARKNSPMRPSEEACANAPQIDVSQARDWMTSNQPPCLVVDLRGWLAFKVGHIAGSINMPVEQLDQSCEVGVPFSTSQRVLLVCPAGEQSKRFAAYLSERGITCASLTGGFTAWRDADQPIEKSTK
jgi:rhodanese-related sulfurtransferase